MFKNKRFLITQPIIRGINGSTVVTLELAQELINQGAEVTVYTCDYDNPAKTYYQKSKIKVVTADENPSFKLNDFDYIWVHSQILPASIINYLNKKLPNKLPRFIFLHMSGMDWIPDEKPWIYNLENKLSSLSLFISEEVKDINIHLLDLNIPTIYYRNPAPDNYKKRNHPPKKTLQNLLIVSSHPPKEVLKAKDILTTKHHINVTILGEDQEKYELFSKSLLEKYDAVLTIAKTVPYCLISGTPVYIYDAFGGGPGWLNSQNFNLVKKRNFSGYQNFKYPNYEGDGFNYKTANQIVDEIINGYPESLNFHTKTADSFYQDFTLSSVLPKIISAVQPRRISTFDDDYAGSILAAQTFAILRFKTVGSLYTRDAHINTLTRTNHTLTQQNHQLQTKITELEEYRHKAESILNSHAYRIFNRVIKPYKVIRKGLFHEK